MTFGGQCGSVLGLRAAKGLSSVPAWFRADSGTNLIKQGEIVTGRPCGSVDQWSECSHGLREVLGSSPGRAMCFHPPVTFGGQCGSVLGLRVAKRLSRRFRHGSGQIRGRRADSGTNLIKQGEIVTGRPCGSVAQWSECSHGMREALSSSPGRAMCFFLPCDTGTCLATDI